MSYIETFVNEGTPLMVGGVLYVSTSLSQVAAIDAATGQTLWTHDPEVWKLGTPPNHGWVHRGCRALDRRPRGAHLHRHRQRVPHRARRPHRATDPELRRTRDGST